VTEKQETRADKAWGWVTRVTGLGVFVGAAAADALNDKATPSFAFAFLGILLAVFPTAEVRVILRDWRRNGTGGSP
jgi:hypothetical protein